MGLAVKLILLILVLILFWVKGIFFLDPDFGWHLKVGEIIQKTGIPKTDPFSYTMPSYHFVDHEWFTDVFLSKFHPLIGQIGFSFIFAIFAVLAIIIQVPSSQRKLSIIPVLLALMSILGPSGIRPQVITWFFFSLLVLIVLNKEIWNKYKWFLPFIFFIWANLHGGFAIGIATIIIVVLLKAVQHLIIFKKKNSKHKTLNPKQFQNSNIQKAKKILYFVFWLFRFVWDLGFRIWNLRLGILEQFKNDICILLLSIIATLINPYGINLWKEILLSVSDGSLRWSISEWMPSIFVLDFALWVYFSFSIVMVLRYRKKLSFLELILYFGSLLTGLSSIRNMPFWLIVSLPMTIKAIHWFYDEAKSKKDGILRFNKAYKVFLVIVFMLSILQAVISIEASKSLNENSFYPKKAVEFLKTHESKGQLYSQYGWGGYLIWKYPSKKVFIDGRMPSWRRDCHSGGSTINSVILEGSPDMSGRPIGSQRDSIEAFSLSRMTNNLIQNDGTCKGESDYAFRDYMDISNGKLEFKKIADKYNIDTVLLPPPQKESKKGFIDKLENRLEKLFERPDGRKKYPDLFIQLKKEGWKEIYKDKVSVIYRK